MLNDRDLELMRDTQEKAMDDTVIIQRRVMVTDGFGGYKESSLAIVASGVPVRIVPTAVLEGLGQIARPAEVTNYTIRFPQGTDVQDRDIILRESDGTELKVEALKNPRTWDTVLTVTAEMVA